jgi:hypothetical protein
LEGRRLKRKREARRGMLEEDTRRGMLEERRWEEEERWKRKAGILKLEGKNPE